MKPRLLAKEGAARYAKATNLIVPSLVQHHLGVIFMRLLRATVASIFLLNVWAGPLSAAEAASKKIRAVLWIGGHSHVYLTVRVTEDKRPITQGLPATFEVKSELYQSKPLAEDCRVLAVAKEKGKDAEYPSVWTRAYGKGRVVTILPAHWPEAYKVPEFQKLIAASARWAARQ